MKRLKIAVVDITYNCTMCCKHCYNSSGEPKSRMELSDDQFIGVFRQLAMLGVEQICLCGGEPMLKKELVYEAIKEIHKIDNSIDVNMVSNGELIDETEARKIVCSGLRAIQISMDGANAETYEWLRLKKGSFDNAIKAIRNLDDIRKQNENVFDIYVSCVPTTKNINKFYDTMKLAKSIGVDQFRVQPLMYLGRARKHFDKRNAFDDKIYKKLHLDLVKASRELAMAIEWGDPIDHLYGDAKEFKTLTINAYGDILLSSYIPVAFGNVLNAPIENYLDKGLFNYWNIPAYRMLRECFDDYEEMDVGYLFGAEEVNEGVVIFDILEKETMKKLDSFAAHLEERLNV